MMKIIRGASQGSFKEILQLMLNKNLKQGLGVHRFLLYYDVALNVVLNLFIYGGGLISIYRNLTR